MHTPVRDPAALLAVVPSLLGYEPEESVVTIYLDARGTVLLGARLSLSDMVDRVAIDQLAAPAHRPEVASLILVIYAQSVDHGHVVLLRDALASAAQVPVSASFTVEPWGWQSVEDPGSCGDRDSIDLHPARLETIASGRAPSPSRDAHAESVHQPVVSAPGVHDDALAVVHALASDPGAAGPMLADALDDPQTGPGTLAALVLPESGLLEACSRIHRRDAGEHLARWSWVVRSCAGPLAAGAQLVCAVAAYLHGDGAVLNVLLQSLLRTQPGHPTVQWLAEAARSGRSPDDWPLYWTEYEVGLASKA